MTLQEQFDDVLEYARSIEHRVESWADFSDAVSNCGDGYPVAFGWTQDEWSAFIDSPQGREIFAMIDRLTDKFGIEAGSIRRANRCSPR